MVYWCRMKAPTKIPDWAKKVQAAYRQKFKIGDIVHVKREGLGVIIESTDYRGDEEVSVDQLCPAEAAYSVWFKDGPSSWHDEDQITLVQRG